METLNAILSSITTIAALVTAIAAIAAPVITAKTQARASMALKELDLLHAEKTRSYEKLIEALANCRVNPSTEDADKLYEALYLASIYSSSETSRTLLALSGMHLNENRAAADVAPVYEAAIGAMRAELEKEWEDSQKPNRKKHHNNA